MKTGEGMQQASMQQPTGIAPSTTERAPLRLMGERLSVPVDFILAACYARDEDTILVAGSLVDGIGNQYSDIDVYVLTPTLRQSKDIDIGRHHRVIDIDRTVIRAGDGEKTVRLIHTVLPNSGVKVDIELCQWQEVDVILDRLNSIFRYAVTTPELLTQNMTYREKQFLHRLHNCIVLRDNDRYQSIRQSASRSQFCYLNYRWHASDFSMLLDIMGAWQAGELLRAADLARDNLASQAVSLLALCGETNCSRKWLIAMLDRLPRNLMQLSEGLKRLLVMPGCDTGDGLKRYVAETLDLTDTIFAETPDLMARWPDWPTAIKALELLTEGNKTEQPTRYRNLEYAYRAKSYGVPGLASRDFLSEVIDAF